MTDPAKIPAIPFKVRGQCGSIPAIGLGTVGLHDQVCVDSCREALGTAGYRMFDTALSYGNQKSVGEALRNSAVAREDVFVTTKVSFCPRIDGDRLHRSIWLYDPINTKGNEAETIDICLRELGLDHVDLLLVHNPTTSLEEYGAASLPHFFELFSHKGNPMAIRPEKLPDGTMMRDVVIKAKMAELVRTCDKEVALETRKRTWAAMEQALRDGKCKCIGVSNYPAALLEEMETYANIMPAVNQVECTPWFARPELRKTAKRLGVVIMAYGTGQSMRIRQDETVRKLANKLGKSSMQVLLRWNFQSGIASIPNSKSADHIQENADIFDWRLTADEVSSLDGLNEDHPFYWDPKPTLATID